MKEYEVVHEIFNQCSGNQMRDVFIEEVEIADLEAYVTSRHQDKDFTFEREDLADGTVILADEVSPDTCRLWDVKTNEKLDKDRFRRDLGNVEEAYEEVFKRLGIQ